jgi:hypothetical protein
VTSIRLMSFSTKLDIPAVNVVSCIRAWTPNRKYPVDREPTQNK